MSPENDQLTPIPFEPASSQERPPALPEHKPPGQRWVLPALLGLVLLALAVLFWRPQPGTPAGAPESAGAVAEGGGAERGGSGAAGGAAGRAPANTVEATPWADAQAAQLRKEAQDTLAQLLELQRELEGRGVKEWAAEDFNDAIAGAGEGDKLYQQREYVAAREHYAASLAALQAIEDSIPTRLAEQLDQARRALEAGAPEQVSAHLARAALLAPDSPDLAALQARAAQLPAVLEALDRAAAAEAGGDLGAAVAALEQANTLDPEHQRVASELGRVRALDTASRFNRAMSEGYAALDAGRYDTARGAFQRARALHPDAGEVRSALQELETAATAQRLASLRQSGAAREADEDWPAAVERYEQALAIDPSVVFAQEGLQRARPRAALQGELEAVIKEPGRLADPTVAQATASLLARAQEVSPAGPVLSDQIEQLERLLAQANEPITVTLRSDQQTSVTVYRVARLGQFAERELSLRPGTYTAVGTRNGYRDVRRNFTLSPDQSPEPVVIVCTEPI